MATEQHNPGSHDRIARTVAFVFFFAVLFAACRITSDKQGPENLGESPSNIRRVGRERGTVKWFNTTSGYGFIGRESGADIFVDTSAIHMEGYKVLSEGQTVEFEVITGPKGLQAKNVKILESQPLWQLPFSLGDSRQDIRAMLGDRKSCVPGYVSETCDTFPNSGMSVGYDGDRVNGITIGGGTADADAIPYESQILYGITIRDQLPQLKAKLGDPNIVVIGPPPRYKWRKPPWLIEVVVGTDRDGDRKDRILWITITNAIG